MDYEVLAGLYDRLIDIDYDKLVEFYEKMFDKYLNKRPELVLDLACGTGNVSMRLSEKGYDVTGVDVSEEMLAVAKRKSDILFICQDMTQLDLYGTYQAAVCALDGVNHLLSEDEVESFFKRLWYFIEPNGVFIFDMLTEYKFKNDFNNDIVTDYDDVLYIWQSEQENGIYVFDLTFFVKEKENLYKKYIDTIYEKCYNLEVIKTLLQRCGFEICAVFSDDMKSLLAHDSKRAFFVVKRV